MVDFEEEKDNMTFNSCFILQTCARYYKKGFEYDQPKRFLIKK